MKIRACRSFMSTTWRRIAQRPTRSHRVAFPPRQCTTFSARCERDPRADNRAPSVPVERKTVRDQVFGAWIAQRVFGGKVREVRDHYDRILPRLAALPDEHA